MTNPTRSRHRTLQEDVVRLLLSRKGATLRQLVEVLGEDYWSLWGALCALRDRGVVYPAIRKGEGSGRPKGSPTRYRLARAAQRRIGRRQGDS